MIELKASYGMGFMNEFCERRLALMISVIPPYYFLSFLSRGQEQNRGSMRTDPLCQLFHFFTLLNFGTKMK